MIKNTAHKVTSAWREFLRLESAGGLILVAAAVVALVLANSPLADTVDDVVLYTLSFSSARGFSAPLASSTKHLRFHV